jgi:hypothetical protein
LVTLYGTEEYGRFHCLHVGAIAELQGYRTGELCVVVRYPPAAVTKQQQNTCIHTKESPAVIMDQEIQRLAFPDTELRDPLSDLSVFLPKYFKII